MKRMIPLLAICLATSIVSSGLTAEELRPRSGAPGPSQAQPTPKGATTMRIHYLEIVTKDVDKTCAAYSAMFGVKFGDPDAGLGYARTAPLPDGSLVGVRAPLRDSEDPVVRPYWLVDDIEAALAEAVKAGAVIAHPPLEIPGHGTFAIYIQGGIQHGLWKL